jgi:hypothetical protein
MNIEQTATDLGPYREVVIGLNCGYRVEGYLKYIDSKKLGIASAKTNFCGRYCHIVSIEECDRPGLRIVTSGVDWHILGYGIEAPSNPHYYEFSCLPGVPVSSNLTEPSSPPSKRKRNCSLLNPRILPVRDKVRRCSSVVANSSRRDTRKKNDA